MPADIPGHNPSLVRPARDVAKARQLLAEAGYPNGFGVTLDCVNVAFREAVCQAATAMLNQVVTPVVCQKGSVGACGDLAPMAQMALVLMGEGEELNIRAASPAHIDTMDEGSWAASRWAFARGEQRI